MTVYEYEIINSEGRSGGPWLRRYASRGEAALAIREALGWDDITLSDSYDTDRGVAWSAYPTDEDCDSDASGAHAPRILRVKS